MLEPPHIFFKRFFDSDKIDELEMDTDFLFSAFSGDNLEDVNLLEKKRWVVSTTF